MTFHLGQVLTAKTSFQNNNTIDSFFVKDMQYTIRVVHERYRINNDRDDAFRSTDYILVNNLPGYSFYTEDMYYDKYNYVWNCFYTPNELRKIKLEKIKQIAIP